MVVNRLMGTYVRVGVYVTIVTLVVVAPVPSTPDYRHGVLANIIRDRNRNLSARMRTPVMTLPYIYYCTVYGFGTFWFCVEFVFSFVLGLC
jgi:hypothetical protein